MLHTVKKVEYLDGYKLKLKFNNGKIKTVDLDDMVNDPKYANSEWFKPLKKKSYFKKVKCDGITIIWPNGLDLCPDVLYEEGK